LQTRSERNGLASAAVMPGPLTPWVVGAIDGRGSRAETCVCVAGKVCVPPRKPASSLNENPWFTRDSNLPPGGVTGKARADTSTDFTSTSAIVSTPFNLSKHLMAKTSRILASDNLPFGADFPAYLTGAK
jgi:hypothetical protein